MQFSNILTYLLIVFSLLLFSCTSREEIELEQEITDFISKDKNISTEDFEELSNLANNLKLDLYEIPHNLCEKIIEVAEKKGAGKITIECPSGTQTVEGGGNGRSRGGRDRSNRNNTNSNRNNRNGNTASANNKDGYQVYIENSGSMFGYMTGDTEFKDNILDFLSRIDREEEKMLISFINNQAYPILATDTSFETNNRKINPEIVKDNISDFMRFVNPNNAKKYGDVSSSELNKIFEKVVKQVKKDGKTAIIVSDCIYSLSNSQDVKGGLSNQKYTTKVIFQEKSFREKHAVLMIQNESSFNGKYYNYAQPNTGIPLKGTRPFYIWVIGKNENMVDFVTKYNIENLKGYKNHVFFMDTEKNNVPYYSIFPNTDKEGRFKTVRTKRSNNIGITAIEEIDYNRDGDFQFSVGMDLSKIPAHNSYITNEANYVIESTSGDIFEIVDIKNASTATIGRQDKKYMESSTHFISLLSEHISTGEQDLTITLTKQIPEWVQQSSNTDDTDIDGTLEQTFGLSYLVSGVSEAYDPKGNGNNFFSINLKLRR